MWCVLVKVAQTLTFVVQDIQRRTSMQHVSIYPNSLPRSLIYELLAADHTGMHACAMSIRYHPLVSASGICGANQRSKRTKTK